MVNRETGEEECKFSLANDSGQMPAIYGTPVISNDKIFVADYNGILYVLPLECDGVWDSEEEVQVGTGQPIVGSPVVVDDIVVVGSSDGSLYAFDIIVNGAHVALAERWEVPFQTGNRIWSTPAVVDGVVYFGSLDHKLYAVNLDDGTSKWMEPFKAQGGIVAGPVVVDGRIYFGAFDSVFYAIDSTTGNLEWIFDEAKEWFWAQALVHKDRVYAPSLDGNLYALSLSDGDLLWKLETEGPILGSPVIIGDRIAVPSEEGGVYLVRLEDGQIDSQCKLSDGVKLRASLAVGDRTLYFPATDHAIRSLEIQEFDKFWQLDENRPAWEHFTSNDTGPDRWEQKCA